MGVSASRSRHRLTALLVITAAVAGLATAVVAAPETVAAGGPPCGNAYHYFDDYCVDGGWRGGIMCTGQANVRVGPYREDPPHDYIGNYGWVLWASHDDLNHVYINGGCGGPTSQLWYLLYKGWVHRSVLDVYHA
jgi:hypothetical protein